MTATTNKNVERAWAFYNGPWKAMKYVMAPMVDQSELPFRMLSRSYQPQMVCYTPMLHSKLFATEETYRKDHFSTCESDRPLIAQFCGNEGDQVVAAAKLVQDRVDAVDLNLGCPQGIAKRGRYGAFLMKEPRTVQEVVTAMVAGVSCPVTCKIRVLDTVESTVKFARMLEDCGIVLLTVHGRTLNQKPNKAFRADWQMIKAVKDALEIPVIANGNIRKFSDVEECLRATGCDGVMSAETLLENPALYNGELNLPKWVMCKEYLRYVHKYPVPLRMVKPHLYQMLEDDFRVHVDLRDRLTASGSLEEFEAMLDVLGDRITNSLPCPVPVISTKAKYLMVAKDDNDVNNNNNNNNNNVGSGSSSSRGNLEDNTFEDRRKKRDVHLSTAMQDDAIGNNDLANLLN